MSDHEDPEMYVKSPPCTYVCTVKIVRGWKPLKDLVILAQSTSRVANGAFGTHSPIGLGSTWNNGQAERPAHQGAVTSEQVVISDFFVGRTTG